MSDRNYLNDENENEYLSWLGYPYFRYENGIKQQKNLTSKKDNTQEWVNPNSSQIIFENENTTTGNHGCQNGPSRQVNNDDIFTNDKINEILNNFLKVDDDNKTSLTTQAFNKTEKINNLYSLNQDYILKESGKKNNDYSKLKDKISPQKDDNRSLKKLDEDYFNKNANLNINGLDKFYTRNENNICNSLSQPHEILFNNNESSYSRDSSLISSLRSNKKFIDSSKHFENHESNNSLNEPNESNNLLGNKRNKPNEESRNIKEKKEQLNDLDNFDNISEINRNDSEDHLNDPEIIPIVQELGTNKKGNENKINIDNNFNVDIPLRENNAITSIKYYVVKKFIDEINEKIAVKDKTKQLCVTKFAKSINRNKNLESYRQKWKDILLIIYKDEEINENNLENNRETIKHIYDNKENFEDAYNLLEMPFDKYYNNFLNNNLEEFISKQREKQFADFKQKKYKMIIEKLIQDKNWDELNIIKDKFISFISLNKEGEKKIKTKPLSEEDFFHCYSYTIYKPEEFQNYVKTIDKSLNFDFEYEKEIIERNMCLLKNTAKRYENWFSEKTPRKIKKKFFKVKSSSKNS